MSATALIPKNTTVLVVGGGPNGLVASGLLAQHGIDNVVVERRNGTQRAPAAHVIRHRPLEVLTQLGIREEIRMAIPRLSLENINWCTTLAGEEVGRLDLRAGKPPAEDPLDEAWINLSQSLLEPILAKTVEAAPESHLFFGAECVDIEQDEKAVTALIRSMDGQVHRIEADWVIAADGAGSRIRKRLGIEMEGIGPLTTFMRVHFRADLTRWTENRPGPLFWIMNPESSGTLIVHDPRRSYVFMTPAIGSDDEEATLPDRLRKALGVDADFEIVSIDSWMAYNQVAARYREGRVFLAGDAAHRFPPTGGLGLNTGILDVHNLVWKIAMIEKGLAEDALLDRYEAECRPAARKNADVSLENMIGLGQVNAAVGRFEDLAGLEARLTSLSAEDRQILDAAIDAQFSHFASDGQYPEPARTADELPVMHWHAPYAGFTFFAEEGSKGSAIAAEVSRRVRVPISFEPLERGAAARLPVRATAFLTRPDGIIEWVGDDLATNPADGVARICAALERLLGIRSKN